MSDVADRLAFEQHVKLKMHLPGYVIDEVYGREDGLVARIIRDNCRPGATLGQPSWRGRWWRWRLRRLRARAI